MKNETGYPFYGQRLGVLVFSTVTPRAVGDPGNALSFDYPVRYEVVEGGFADLIEGSPRILQSLDEAGRRLAAVGVRAVLGDCGLMSLYQTELAARWDMLFAGSSLCQLPLMWQLVGRTGSLGVITGHSELLSARHLESSGATAEMKLSVQGMEDEQHFREIVIEGGLHLDVEQMRRDVLSAARKLREKTPDLRAVVLECSNIGTYSADVVEELGLPVFDVITAANLMQQAVAPPRYRLE